MFASFKYLYHTYFITVIQDILINTVDIIMYGKSLIYKRQNEFTKTCGNVCFIPMPAREFRKSVCLCDSIRHRIMKLIDKFTTYAFLVLPLYLLTEEGNVGLYLTAHKTGHLATKKHEFLPLPSEVS